MGFSLAVFFEELQAVLAMKQKDGRKLQKLKELIKRQEQYAKDCGLIEKYHTGRIRAAITRG